jgi:hypothetical protein
VPDWVWPAYCDYSRQFPVKLGVNKAYNHAMRWIWEQSGWPGSRYNQRSLEDRDTMFRIDSERLTGRYEALPIV